MKNKRESFAIWKRAAIVLALIFSGLVASQGADVLKEAEKQPETTEAQRAAAGAAGESAEGRIRDLERQLQQLRGEYASLRSKYADLYMNARAQQDRLKAEELRAAILLRNEELPDSMGDLEALRLALTRQKKVQDTLAELEKLLDTLTEILRPSESLRFELAERMKALKGAVADASLPLLQMTQRGENEEKPRGTAECMVLSVNQEEEIFFLNRGKQDGVRPGAGWKLVDAAGRTVARVKTVQCRSKVCAAVLLTGRMEQVKVGSRLLSE